MLKELAQYITGLAVEAQKTEVMDINGETYIDGKRLMPDACNYKELNTLDAAIDFLHVTCKDGDFEYPLIVSATHKDIEVYSSLDKYKNVIMCCPYPLQHHKSILIFIWI